MDHEMLDFDDELTIYFSDDFQDASTPTISNDSTQTDTDILLQLSESDESYVFSQETVSSDGDKEENPHSATIRRLEDVITGLLSQISDAMSAYDGSPCSGGKIKLELVDRRKPLKTDGTFGTRIITYPHNSRHASAKPLAQVLRVMDLMHEALCNDTPTTKRDMFYKDVALFGSQAVVDKLVDDIAATLNVARWDLNVRASAKGLFCGSGLAIHLHNTDVVRGNNLEGALIPPSEDISRFEVDGNLSWVLIVEKEAVFQTLCHLNFVNYPALPGPGLIITGKGYPDVATRQLVASLARNLPRSVPIVAVVDGDPYGIDILSVYKYGSSSMSYQDDLDAPRIRWGGIMASELSALGVPKQDLIPITKHDEKKAIAMLKRAYIPRRWRKEIQYMLFTRRKAEIEIFSAVEHQNLRNMPQEQGLGTSLLTRYLVAQITQAIDLSTGICP
ncbi:DNA topoisomerase IV, alpha subunit [Trametopsis cervina]|nr:DNA topoisomerase IV, alpha subunit [Trametopsis cervina]